MPGDNYDAPFEILIREEREEFLKDIENFDMNTEDVAPCGDGIYPACPSQIGKTYHMFRKREQTVIPTSGESGGFQIQGRFDDGGYDPARLDYRSQYCRDESFGLPTTTRDLSTTRLLICRVPDVMHLYLMSDTYIDDCDRYFRGYWLEEFTASMDVSAAGGPATSLGRTAYLHEEGQFTQMVTPEGAPGPKYPQIMGYAYDGDTYRLTRESFSFFGPLLSGDAEQISQYRSYALNGRDGKPPTHELSSTNRKLFTYIGEK